MREKASKRHDDDVECVLAAVLCQLQELVIGLLAENGRDLVRVSVHLYDQVEAVYTRK